MPCNWLLVKDANLCKNLAKRQYCASYTFKIQNGVIIPKLCKGCGQETISASSFVSHIDKLMK
ncbi:21158_t:CDS:1, partial [Racocetra persica]